MQEPFESVSDIYHNRNNNELFQNEQQIQDNQEDFEFSFQSETCKIHEQQANDHEMQEPEQLLQKNKTKMQKCVQYNTNNNDHFDNEQKMQDSQEEIITRKIRKRTDKMEMDADDEEIEQQFQRSTNNNKNVNNNKTSEVNEYIDITMNVD